MKTFTLTLLLLCCCCFGCGRQTPPTELPTFTENGHLRVVIERPAGTNHQVTYDPSAQSFYPPPEDSAAAKFDFLPYPGNYGFVPSTRPDTQRDRPLSTLLLAESMPTAFSIEAKPLALVRLICPQGDRYCLLTIPAAPARRLMPDSTLNQLKQNHPAALQILELWLKHHQPADSVQSIQWQDEQQALQQVRAWAVGEA